MGNIPKPGRTTISRKPYSYRLHDGAQTLPDGRVRHFEVKTGRSDDLDRELDQCAKGARIIREKITPPHEIEWHFVPNGKFNSIGPHPQLLDCLTRNKLPVVFHPAA